MPWYKIHLTAEQRDNGDHDVICEKFNTMWLSNLKDFYFEIAMLESRPNTDLSLDLYFSPMASAHFMQIIDDYQGEPCDPPPPDTPIMMADASFRW